MTRKKPTGSSLDQLVVIDRLTVEAPRIEPRGVVTRYRVLRGGKEESRDLAYRFEEDVFDAAGAADDNLASLLGAQVALNYGLFCRRIVFEGRFDRADRAFLRDAASNTAREIYVKKFLEPNPFLVGGPSRMEPERREDYLQAEIAFASAEPAPGEHAWNVSGIRPAVLSSGGKDSLLTFGLLDELEQEPHPIFINESGRHWYTALNGYRHLRDTCSSTARVWTDSDRMFSWMLRHLPFVRSDFSRLRSDEYPIRLWTVAVFLFGALPLMRKRGLGLLTIGDEFDTTHRTAHRGITHYDGLYDQSRYFDVAMTRFFRRKRWGLTQLSLLRPLSELLIEKVLTRRYPDLQRHQVSCHAAHLEGERVLPCGRCEKCRRIIAMLVALEADPTHCGYTAEQIREGMDLLPKKELHQESRGVEHLAWMLQKGGHLASGAIGRRRAHERPEVVQLRFARDRAHIEDVPRSLRRRLYGILLEHCRGSVRKQGRMWVPLDLMRSKELDAPHAVQIPGNLARGPRRADDGSRYLLAEMTWQDAARRLETTDLAILPVGAIEQHGPHLPLDTDAWDADYLARRVAERCTAPRPLVLPLVAYGVSYHHEDFPGTLSVSPETLFSLVREIGMSAARQGISKLIILNGHGGNVPALRFAAQTINRDAHIFTCVESGETSDSDIEAMTETPNDVHAGEVETSTSLATRPNLVQMERARRFVPRFSSEYLDFTSSRSVEWYARTARLSRTGVLGDPTKASPEKGEQFWNVMIEHLVSFIEGLKGMSLEEIYERRY